MDFKTIALVNYEVFRASKYRLDEYVIRDGKRHPFAIICPGGAYRMIASHVEGIPIAKALNEMGYSAFILWYSHGKKAKYPNPMRDMARALKSVLSRADELNLDRENYSLWGSSAGGHLAGAFGTENMGYAQYRLPKPAALVLIYPVITMGERAHRGSKRRLLGKNPSKAIIKHASLEQQVSADYPPTFLWCGEKDRCVDPENSKMMAAALEQAGVPHELIVYPNVGHGVGLGRGKPCDGWFERAVAFWQSVSPQNNY